MLKQPRLMPFRTIDFKRRAGRASSAGGLALAILFGHSQTCIAADFSGIIGGVVGGMMSQAIQQQQYYQQQQQRQQYHQQQYYQQQQQQQMLYQQRQLDVERQRHDTAVSQARREQARAAAEANKRQLRAATESKAAADKLAQEKAAEEYRLQMEMAEESRKEEVRVWKNKLEHGGNKDLTVFIVAHDTKRVVRNLSGDPQFIGPAQGCYPFKFIEEDRSTSEGRFLADVLYKIKKAGGGGLQMDKCSPKTFGEYDVLIYSPEQLDPEVNKTIKRDDIRPLVEAVNEGHFKTYKVFYKSDYETETQRRNDAIAADEESRNQEKKKIEAEFDSRKLTEISAIYLKSPASGVCLGGASNPGLRDMLGKSDSPFADLVTNTTKVHEMTDANLIFLAIKKRECVAVVAQTAVLKDVIIPALRRDNVPFNYHPASVPPARVKELASQNASITGWFR